MALRAKVIAELNDKEHRRLALYEVYDTVRHTRFFRLMSGNDGPYSIEVALLPYEFVALLKAGLEHFEVAKNLMDSVLPKLTRANIVR